MSIGKKMKAVHPLASVLAKEGDNSLPTQSMTKSNPKQTNPYRRQLLGAVVATASLAIGSSEPAHSAAVVTPTISLSQGIYTYAYSVLNNGPTFDLAIIDVPVLQSSNLMDLIAPSGFGISFDPGVGIVSFFEDFDPATTPTFSPSSTNGLFSFTTATAPATVTFQALDAGGNTFTGTTQSAAVPEPGALSLIGLGLVGIASRRKRSVSQSSHS